MAEPATSTPWRHRLAPYVPTLAATARLALLCNLALELARLTSTKTWPWEHKTPVYPLLFLLGTVVVWLLVGLVHAVVGRLWVTTGVAATTTAVVAVVDHEKVRLRREPLFPSDLEYAGKVGFLSQMVGGRVVLLVVVVALLATGLTLAVMRRSGGRAAVHGHQRHPLHVRLPARALAVGLCLLSLAYLGRFNASDNAARATYELFGASWRRAAPQAVYLGNGFVGGFLRHLDVPESAEPPGYSRRTMARIASTYRAAAQRTSRRRNPRALDQVNIVTVLSETFTDPTALHGLRIARDPIPFTRRLMASTTSGRMLSPGLGGGTANVEFEVLTGLSMSGFPPQLTTPYNALVPYHRTFPSAVGWWKQTGHRAVAIHPFTTEMYRRNDVYRVLGFDEFVLDETMTTDHRIGDDAFISDRSAFAEVLHQLETDPEPMLVHLVTMQNHVPYTNRYDDPVPVTTSDGDTLEDTGHYVRGLAHTDDALRAFIGRLRRLEEKTVVVFYGDHLPSGYPESVFEANGRRTMHETPFFVWANFPGPAVPQPTTSPIYFMPMALERADAPVPAYYALLDELREELPAFDIGIRINPHDMPVTAPLPPEAARVLRHYRLVHYDLAAGERYSEAAMFGSAGEPASHANADGQRAPGPAQD